MADKNPNSVVVDMPLEAGDEHTKDEGNGECTTSFSETDRAKTSSSKSSNDSTEENVNQATESGSATYINTHNNAEANGEGLNELLGLAVDKMRNGNARFQELSASVNKSSAWKMSLEGFSSKKIENIEGLPKRLRAYYEAQNELIEAYETIASNRQSIDMDAQSLISQQSYSKAILFSKVTFLINFLLMVAKAVASVLSGSIAIISSLVDSCLDLVSGSVMWWASRAVQKRDPYNYPQGRTKLEPLAVIILAVIMSLTSIQLIREAITKIIDLAGGNTSLPTVDAVTFAITGSTVVVKLILWLVCRNVNSSIVQALAQDHRNDVLSNAVAIICGYLGSKDFEKIVETYEYSYIDPSGAILICLYILFNWWQTGSEQIRMLTGHTAKADYISKLTWMCINHHPRIRHIETLRAFHFGSNFLVEVDIVLPEDMPLEEAHNIGESLQKRLESMPEVERAFVHLDFEFTHKPSSEHKIV